MHICFYMQPRVSMWAKHELLPMPPTLIHHHMGHLSLLPLFICTFSLPRWDTWARILNPDSLTSCPVIYCFWLLIPICYPEAFVYHWWDTVTDPWPFPRPNMAAQPGQARDEPTGLFIMFQLLSAYIFLGLIVVYWGPRSTHLLNC